MMDRKDEIIDLVARLASLIIDERSEMRHEVAQLRETVNMLQETVAALNVQVPPISPMQETVASLNIPAVPDLQHQEQEDTQVDVTGEDSMPEFIVEENHEPATVTDSEPEPVPEHESEPEPVQDPDSEVLRPRDREEQMRDTSEWGMFFGSEMDVDFYDDQQDESIIGDLLDFKDKPADPLWMTDVPGPAVKSVYDAISNNDRILFIRELFDEDGEQFCLSMDRIDECPDFGQVVKEMRIAFPEWDETSDVVYQFYMVVRRKFR